MSGQTSQPNLNSMVAALAHTRRDTGLDLDALNQCADYWETVREFYAPFDTGPKAGTAEVYLHEMPGGQYTNLKEQAESMGLGGRWHEIARTYADVNMAFGDIVKVTPSSKVVGDMAIFLVNHDMTMAAVRAPDARPQPDAADFGDRDVHGIAGRAGGRLAEGAAEDHSARRQTATGRPGAQPAEGGPGGDRRAELEKKIGRRPTRDEVLSYLMYPDVFVKFATGAAGLRRRGGAADAAVLLRHGARRAM